MKRALTLIGVVLAVAAVGLLWWTQERRSDDELACSMERVRDLSATGCDVMSWWPTIGLATVALLVFVLAARVDRTPPV